MPMLLTQLQPNIRLILFHEQFTSVITHTLSLIPF